MASRSSLTYGAAAALASYTRWASRPSATPADALLREPAAKETAATSATAPERA